MVATTDAMAPATPATNACGESDPTGTAVAGDAAAAVDTPPVAATGMAIGTDTEGDARVGAGEGAGAGVGVGVDSMVETV